jgi:hypothetical protein
MTRITSDVAGGNTGSIDQYNNLRREAEASSRLLASAQATPNNTLRVSEGAVYFGDTRIDYAGGNSGAFANTVSTNRIDCLSLSPAGDLVITQGVEGASPAEPTCPTDNLLICFVYIKHDFSHIDNASDGTNAYIYKDIREFLKKSANLNIASFIANENLLIGTPVGISNLVDGYAVKANRTNSYVDSGITTPSGGMDSHHVCPIGGDKFAYLQYNANGTGTLWVTIGSIDRTTNILSIGTPVAVTATFNNNGTGFPNVAICKLDTDRFVVFYLNDDSTTVIKYRVGSVSGTTITLGAETTASTSASTVATSNSWGADNLGADKGVFFYKAVTTTSSKVVVFTASGNTLTFGAEVTPSTNSQKNQGSIIKKINTDKFVLVTFGATIYAQVSTVSGVTQTAGTEVQISAVTSSDASYANYVVSPVADTFVFRTRSASSTDTLVGASTVSTRTITAGTPVNLASLNCSGIMFAKSATLLYVTGSDNNLSIRKITLSGNTITDNGLKMSGSYAITTTQSWWGVYLDNGYAIYGNMSINSPSRVNIWIEGMANNFVGVAQATVNKGDPISFLVRGIDANQTDLGAGGQYGVFEGAFVLVSSLLDTGAGTANISTLPKATAISDTEVII